MKRESRTVDRSHQVESATQRHLPLVDLLVDTHAELMELAVTSGLQVLTTMLEEDRTAIAARAISIRLSAKRHAPARCRARWSSEGGRLPRADHESAAMAPKWRCRRFSPSPTRTR